MKETFFFLIWRIPFIKYRNRKSLLFNPQRIIDSSKDQQWMLEQFSESLSGKGQDDKTPSPPLTYFLIIKWKCIFTIKRDGEAANILRQPIKHSTSEEVLTLPISDIHRQAKIVAGFPGGSMVKNPPADAEDRFDRWSGKVPRAKEQLSPFASSTEPVL